MQKIERSHQVFLICKKGKNASKLAREHIFLLFVKLCRLSCIKHRTRKFCSNFTLCAPYICSSEQYTIGFNRPLNSRAHRVQEILDPNPTRTRSINFFSDPHPTRTRLNKFFQAQTRTRTRTRTRMNGVAEFILVFNFVESLVEFI